MSPVKIELLKALETAPDNVLEQTLQYLKSILPEKSQVTEFQPQTPLGKKLWEIRQRAIANGMALLEPTQIEQELLDQRGGDRDF
jgi:hypothetical protein